MESRPKTSIPLRLARGTTSEVPTRLFLNTHIRARGGHTVAMERASGGGAPGRRSSAQYSGRAAMMAKVASMAGSSAGEGGAPVSEYSPVVIPREIVPSRGHTGARARFPPADGRPSRS